MKIQDHILLKEMEIYSLEKQLRNPLMWFFRKQIKREIDYEKYNLEIYRKIFSENQNKLPQN